MFKKVVLPLLAMAGILFSIFMVYRGMRPPPSPPILYEPPTPPYEHYVAGQGIVESYQENIDIGVAYPDLIMRVCVKEGDEVEQGDLLFALDTRQQKADLATAQQELRVAQTNLNERAHIFSYYKHLNNRSAVSQREYTQALYEEQRAQDNIAVAQARVKSLKTRIERAHICAPIDGIILQKNIRPGEFANVNPFDRKSLIILGSKNNVQVRVQVAEEDAWRIMKDQPAIGFVRGNSDTSIPLTFHHIEPYLVPKRSLTGSDFERVDTRVLEIIYTFNKKEYPVYIGQLLDIYVQAKPSNIQT